MFLVVQVLLLRSSDVTSMDVGSRVKDSVEVESEFPLLSSLSPTGGGGDGRGKGSLGKSPAHDPT